MSGVSSGSSPLDHSFSLNRNYVVDECDEALAAIAETVAKQQVGNPASVVALALEKDKQAAARRL